MFRNSLLEEKCEAIVSCSLFSFWLENCSVQYVSEFSRYNNIIDDHK